MSRIPAVGLIVALSSALFVPLPAAAQIARAVVRSQLPPTPELDGYVANDILLDFAGQYTGSQLIVTLDRGSIYNHALGMDTPPSEALIELDPNVAWDTFVANGGATANESAGDFQVIGIAVNIDQINLPREAMFGSHGIDIAWGPSGGHRVFDQEGFLVARFTLSRDAVGEALFIASANQVLGVPMVIASGLIPATGFPGEPVPQGAGEQRFRLPIFRGVVGVTIPEPSTFGILTFSLAGLVVLIRRPPGSDAC